MESCVICTRHVPDDNGCTDGCRHRERVTGLLCGVCLQRIRDDLDVIAQTWVIGAAGSLSIGTGAGSEHPLPGGTDWLSWREGSELRGCLLTIAAVWSEDFDLAWMPRTDILTALTWLRDHLDPHGAGHEAIDESAGELHDWTRIGQRHTGDTPSGQVIRCPGIADYCGQYLRVEVSNLDDDVPCHRCGHTWTVARLVWHATQGSTEAWADADAAAAFYRVDPSTLRRWARCGKVQRRNGLYVVGSILGAVRTA